MDRTSNDLASGTVGVLHDWGELWQTDYGSLRKLAAHILARESPRELLSATELVHETYLRLVPSGAGRCEARFDSRLHFFAVAVRTMRRILIDQARHKRAERHGGGRTRVMLDLFEIPASEVHDDVVLVNELLAKLALVKPEVAKMVALRLRAGLGVTEISHLMQVSSRTIDTWWAYACAWLHDEFLSTLK
jgi:RNA polymerase sigma factor (TIGR02999 family)